MLRPILALCIALAATHVAPASARDLMGSWTASINNDPEQLGFSLDMGRHNQNGSLFNRSDFTGLSTAQVMSGSRVPVEFELKREAGTIQFEGTFRSGHGAGEFTFVPNRDYPEGLRRLGVSWNGKRGNDDEDLFALTIFDVSTEFIRSMQAIGYDVSLEKYQEFRIFDVNPGYVRDMAAVGFDHLSADKLVETRIHGATPEYIRQMRAAGNDLPLDKYIESRIFQITPEFAEEMSHAGYPDLDRDMLVQFRIQGVTSKYIDQLRDLGYSRVPPQKLVEMRIHGVTPEFIRRVASAGYRKVPIDKLVQMRIFGIEPEMVRALDDASR